LSEKINALIIEGGIIGCCVADELAKNREDVYVSEKIPELPASKIGPRAIQMSCMPLYTMNRKFIFSRASCVDGNRLSQEFAYKYQLPCVCLDRNNCWWPPIRLKDASFSLISDAGIVDPAALVRQV